METTYTLSQTQDTAKAILQWFPDIRLFLLTGGLGAGKTTLVAAMCEVLGVVDATGSPTFPIINEYLTRSGDSIYHLDLYRLGSTEEAIDIGVEDYLYSDNYTFVEWPAPLESLLPEHFLRIHIENESPERRKVVFLR